MVPEYSPLCDTSLLAYLTYLLACGNGADSELSRRLSGTGGVGTCDSGGCDVGDVVVGVLDRACGAFGREFVGLGRTHCVGSCRSVVDSDVESKCVYGEGKTAGLAGVNVDRVGGRLDDGNGVGGVPREFGREVGNSASTPGSVAGATGNVVTGVPVGVGPNWLRNKERRRRRTQRKEKIRSMGENWRGAGSSRAGASVSIVGSGVDESVGASGSLCRSIDLCVSARGEVSSFEVLRGLRRMFMCWGARDLSINVVDALRGQFRVWIAGESEGHVRSCLAVEAVPQDGWAEFEIEYCSVRRLGDVQVSERGSRLSERSETEQLAKETLAERRVVENRLAVVRGERLLRSYADAEKSKSYERMQAARVMQRTEQAKVATERAYARLRETGNVPGCVVAVSDSLRSDGTAISPDSSVSQQEIREMAKQLADLRLIARRIKADPSTAKMYEYHEDNVGVKTAYTLDSDGLPPVEDMGFIGEDGKYHLDTYERNPRYTRDAY